MGSDGLYWTISDDREKGQVHSGKNYATRYPEAFPMRNQDAESVAIGMIKMFSRVGVPK